MEAQAEQLDDCVPPPARQDSDWLNEFDPDAFIEIQSKAVAESSNSEVANQREAGEDEVKEDGMNERSTEEPAKDEGQFDEFIDIQGGGANEPKAAETKKVVDHEAGGEEEDHQLVVQPEEGADEFGDAATRQINSGLNPGSDEGQQLVAQPMDEIDPILELLFDDCVPPPARQDHWAKLRMQSVENGNKICGKSTAKTKDYEG